MCVEANGKFDSVIKLFMHNSVSTLYDILNVSMFTKDQAPVVRINDG